MEKIDLRHYDLYLYNQAIMQNNLAELKALFARIDAQQTKIVLGYANFFLMSTCLMQKRTDAFYCLLDYCDQGLLQYLLAQPIGQSILMQMSEQGQTQFFAIIFDKLSTEMTKKILLGGDDTIFDGSGLLLTSLQKSRFSFCKKILLNLAKHTLIAVFDSVSSGMLGKKQQHNLAAIIEYLIKHQQTALLVWFVAQEVIPLDNMLVDLFSAAKVASDASLLQQITQRWDEKTIEKQLSMPKQPVPDTDAIFSMIRNNTLTQDSLNILLSSGVDINDVNVEDHTALSLACSLNENITAKLLLEAGAKVDADEDDPAALAFAVKNNNIDLVRMLLNHGATACMIDEHDGDYEVETLPIRQHNYSMTALLMKQFSTALEGDAVKPDIINRIKDMPSLNDQSSLITLVESAQFSDNYYHFEGGNADDKYEIINVTFASNAVQLAFMHLTNWSYGDSIIDLNVIIDGEEQQIRFASDTNDTILFSADTLAILSQLAIALKLPDVTLYAFGLFMVILLSKMTQFSEHSEQDIAENTDFMGYLQEICGQKNIDARKVTMIELANLSGKK